MWFSAKSTPTCVGGSNWRTIEFFVGRPAQFFNPLLQENRDRGHISEIEFLVEAICTLIWSNDSETLIMCGLTDNMCANMRIAGGKAKHGVAIRLTRMFYNWLLHQRFRFHSIYIRSGRNISPDFSSRSSEEEIDILARQNDMARIRPLN